MNKQLAERERAADQCPDCGRPRKVLGGCIIRGSDQCIRAERDRLKAQLAAVEKLNAESRELLYGLIGQMGPECFWMSEEPLGAQLQAWCQAETDRRKALRAEANHG